MKWTFEFMPWRTAAIDNDLQRLWSQGWSAQKDATVYHHPETVAAWFDLFAAERRFTPWLAVGCNGMRTIFYPLQQMAESWSLGTRTIEPLGGAANMDYQDPFLDGSPLSPTETEEFWLDFRAAVAASPIPHDRVRLYRLRSPWWCSSLQESMPIFHCPRIDLAGRRDLDEILAGLSSSHRGDVRRQRRRLAESGEVSMTIFKPDEESAARQELPSLLEAYVARKNDPGFAKGGEEFLARVLAALLPTGRLHFSVLRCDKRPAHWHFGFTDSHTMYWYKPVMAPEFAGHSPGKIHVAVLVEDAMARGLHWFDFLYGEEPYKAFWCRETTALRGVGWWRTGARTTIRRYWFETVRPNLRNLWRRFEEKRKYRGNAEKR